MAQGLILESECLSGLAVGTKERLETSFQDYFPSLSFEEGHHSLDPGSGCVSIMKNVFV